jgi:hypothetical protein
MAPRTRDLRLRRSSCALQVLRATSAVSSNGFVATTATRARRAFCDARFLKRRMLLGLAARTLHIVRPAQRRQTRLPERCGALWTHLWRASWIACGQRCGKGCGEPRPAGVWSHARAWGCAELCAPCHDGRAAVSSHDDATSPRTRRHCTSAGGRRATKTQAERAVPITHNHPSEGWLVGGCPGSVESAFACSSTRGGCVLWLFAVACWWSC